MGTRNVRLEEEIYDRVMARKREDETISDAVGRLIDDVSLLDLADETAEYDAERARELKEALDRTADADDASLAELSEKTSE